MEDVAAELTISGNFAEFAEQGHAARDRGNWAHAEERYRRALEIDESAAPIWVQYGHALKEQGKIAPAVDAYRTALRLDPANADTHLQLGKALKLSGDRRAAAEAYWEALKIDPLLHHATVEIEALGSIEEDLTGDRVVGRRSSPFEAEAELTLLLTALHNTGTALSEPLISDPVFAVSGAPAGRPPARADSAADQLAIVPGPLGIKTRADSAVFNELDPAYADEDIPLTRHMVHTWHLFGMPRQFHLNSDRNRLAFIVWYYNSLTFDVGAPAEKLVTALNFPAQAYGPLTRFLFSIWQSEYRHQDKFDVQEEHGYVNFVTDVLARGAASRHIPEQLLPSVLFNAIHEPAIGEPPHQVSKAAYSIWHRTETYRAKYNHIEDWQVRQAFNFELLIRELSSNVKTRLISPDTISFWSRPVSPEFPGLSRFAAALAHISPRFANDIAASPMEIAKNAATLATWFGCEVAPRFPQFGVFSTMPTISSRAPGTFPEAARSVRSELRQFGVSHFPGERAEEIDLLVIGPIAAQSGLGSGTRRSIGALERTQCNFRTLNFTYSNPSVMLREPEGRRFRGENPKAILWHINAEYLQDSLHMLQMFTKDRYNIGYFFWETETMPKANLLSVSMIDEIWTPSEFVARCYSPATTVPVVNVGTSVQLPKIDSFLSRSYFGFGDEFVFLFSFDGHSSIHRKNPAAAVRAFLKAFPDKAERVRLVLKTQNLLQTKASWGVVNGRHEELFELCSKDRRVEIIDRTMTVAAYYSLKEACDCYVSLHRSEGFGYGPAEAMALGKPVIMTNYSANVEFAAPDNCLLVNAKLIHVRDGEYLRWFPEMMWADVDIGHAATQMRRVFDDREFAAQMGRHAKESINRDFGVDAIARRYAARLTELGLNGNSDGTSRAMECSGDHPTDATIELPVREMA